MLFYFTGSMITYEPTEECVVDFWQNGLLKRMPVSSSNPRFMIALSLLRDTCPDKTTCARMMKDDFKKLFSGDERALVPSSGSSYPDTSYGTNTGCDKVREFYDSYGWTSRFRGKYPDDHLGVELLFLTRLVEKYMTLDDKVCRNEMQNEIIRFIDHHILTWVPKWNQLIQTHADSIYYKGIGLLIYAIIEDIRILIVTKAESDRSADDVRNLD